MIPTAKVIRIFIAVLLANVNWPALRAEEGAEVSLAVERAKYEEDLSVVDKLTEEKIAQVVADYVAALEKVEKAVQASGNLDRVMAVLKEKEMAAKEGKAEGAAAPDFEKERKVFVAAMDAVLEEEESNREVVKVAYLEKLRALEAELTKSGQIPSAIEVRKERDQLSKPAGAMAQEAEPAKFAVPTDAPPAAYINPFKTGTLDQSTTLTAGKYRIKDRVEFKHDGEPQRVAVFPEGTEVRGYTKKGVLYLDNYRVISRKAVFADLEIRMGLGGHAYFVDCYIKDCLIRKGGGWFGGYYMARFHFERCLIEGSLLPEFKTELVGLRLLDCKVVGVKFPSVIFGKKKPSEQIGVEWVVARNTTFEKCTIPLSFVAITEGCRFVNCIFVDDEDEFVPVLDAPVEVTVFERDCTWKAKREVANLTVEKLPLTEPR